MAATFADKFAEALAEHEISLRSLSRKLADGDHAKAEIIRRRLHKYRPKNGGGAAEVVPTEPTRHEIEDAMGLERDALAPDEDAVAVSATSAFTALMSTPEIQSVLADGIRRALARVEAETAA